MKNRRIRFLSLLTALLLCLSCTCLTAYASTQEAAPTGEDALAVPKIEIVTEDLNGGELQKADGYVNAQITVTDTDGSQLTGDVQFKVRGNSTAMVTVLKKSFTFKFAKKAEVLGMGKGKKWILHANAFDPTLLRNYLVFEFARELGLPYTTEQRVVELWLDGSYHGCYMVYEQVQQGKDRVNIDIESNDGMKDFMLEYESNRVEDDVTYINAGGVRFAVSEPEEPNDDQKAYIDGVMQDIANTLKTGTEAQIREKIDVESFAKFYLINEYAKTLDFGYSSVFFYYQDGVLYAGPPWDYDLSLGNASTTVNSAIAQAAARTDGIQQSDKNLYRWLCNKEWFIEEVKNVYRENYDFVANISADGGLLDSLRAQYAEVFEHNYTRWNITKWWMNYQKKPLATYEANYSFLKNWCAERNAWLTEYYDLFPEEVVLLGDANADGSVTILDATTIQRVLASMTVASYNEAAADADEKGTVDILDATVIQRWLAGFSGYENIGKPIRSEEIA